MLNSKKWLALCATGLVGFGVVAPTATSAFAAQKGGNTDITYQTPKPAEWGLSVPSQVDMNRKAKTTLPDPVVFGNARVSIVTSEGTNYSDGIRNHIFTILPTSTNGMKLVNKDVPATSASYRSLSFSQGTAAPTDDMNFLQSSASFSAIGISTKADGSNPAPFVDVQLGAKQAEANLAGKGSGASDIISWTASEDE